MFINPSFGFNFKTEQIGRFPVPEPSPGPMPASAPISPKGKLEELRCHFNNKYKNFEFFDRPLIETGEANLLTPFDGRLNFVNKKHKDLFFEELKKLPDNNNLYGRCRHIYRKSDNRLLKCWLNQYSPQTPAVKKEEDLVSVLFIQTLPKNVIIFPYLNDDFSKWPHEEKIRFYIFLKNAGGEKVVKSFDAFALVAEDARKREKTFIKWACGRLDIASNTINSVNIPELLFQKLDEIVMPQILNMPLGDKRDRLHFVYKLFEAARNVINPISLYSSLVAFHRLPEVWRKLVSFFKMEGSTDDFVSDFGKLLGTLLAMPFVPPVAVGIIKILKPKVTSILKNTKTAFKTLDKALDKTFNPPKKPASAPKEPVKKGIAQIEKNSKTRALRLKRVKSNLETRKNDILKRQKQPAKTKTASSAPQKANYTAPKQPNNYLMHYKTGKTAFEKFIAQKNKSNALLKAALHHLKQSEAANPPPEISFENNWRLCVLKIHSYSWKGAISYFIKALEKDRILNAQRYRLITTHNENNIKSTNHARPVMGAKNKELTLYKNQEKYRSKILYKLYNEIQKKINAQINKFKRFDKETEAAAIDLGKKCTAIHNRISKIEKELQSLDSRIKALRRTNFEIRGPEQILRKSFELSDLEKTQSIQSAELDILKSRWDKLDKEFLKACRKNATAKKKLVDLQKEYIRTFRLRMIWHGLQLWILNN